MCYLFSKQQAHLKFIFLLKVDSHLVSILILSPSTLGVGQKKLVLNGFKF